MRERWEKIEIVGLKEAQIQSWLLSISFSSREDAHAHTQMTRLQGISGMPYKEGATEDSAGRLWVLGNETQSSTSAQYGDIRKWALPPHTIQQKLQLDYKTSITQIHQKIELYGSLTTKDLQKPYPSRQVGGVEMQRGVESHRDTKWHWELPRHGMCRPTSTLVDKNQEGHLRIKGPQPQTRPPSPGFQCQEDMST